MTDERQAGLLLVLGMTALMWVVEIVDSLDSHRLDAYGIRPRHLDRLYGVVTAPFLHVSFGHLESNTVPFVAMGAVIALEGLVRVAVVTATVMGVGGLGTWLIAPGNTIHVGASGVVFGYATYLISRGVFGRRILELAIGALVIAIWGAALLSGLVPRDGISWQGHLCGGIGGVVAGSFLARRPTGQRRAA